MRLTSFIILFLISLAMTAGELHLNHINTSNHLSNNKINTLLKDSDGFLWIGTSSGLYRYDGYTFKNYGPASPEEHTVFDNNIEKLQEDAKGRLWIYSGSKYSVYDPSADRLTTNPAQLLGESGIDGDPTLIHIDGAKSLWIHIQDKGLYRLSPDMKTADIVNDTELGKAQITDIKSTPEGLVTIDNHGNISIIDPVSLDVARKDSYIADELGDKNTYVFTFVYDRDGLGWIYSNERLWLYDIVDGRWLNDMLPPVDHRRFVKILEQDHTGHLWLGRDHKGLEQIIKGENGISFKQIASDPLQGDLSTVTSVYEDNGGTIWIGTYKNRYI